MRRGLKKRLAAAILICLILSSFLSIVFIVTHERHHCTGKGCDVCCQLSAVISALKQTGMCEACVATSLYLSVTVILNAFKYFSSIENLSLVTLKIRIDN